MPANIIRIAIVFCATANIDISSSKIEIFLARKTAINKTKTNFTPSSALTKAALPSDIA